MIIFKIPTDGGDMREVHYPDDQRETILGERVLAFDGVNYVAENREYRVNGDLVIELGVAKPFSIEA